MLGLHCTAQAGHWRRLCLLSSSSEHEGRRGRRLLKCEPKSALPHYWHGHCSPQLAPAAATQDCTSGTMNTANSILSFFRYLGLGSLIAIGVLSEVPGELRPHIFAVSQLEHVVAYF